MEVTVTTPRDTDGLLSVMITGRDFMALGAKAIDEAVERLAKELGLQIIKTALTRVL